MFGAARILMAWCVVFAGFAAEAPHCAALPGADALWRTPGLRFLLAGEMHGTTETPALFADLVCAARASGRPIVVGLERPAIEQGAIDAFLETTDHAAAARVLLSGGDWHSFDGRSSRAMLDLLEALRTLKLSGRISAVVAFSDSRPGDSPASGEQRMASILLAAARGHRNALVIALTGNIHALRQPLPEVGSYPLMAMLLPAPETLSLLVTDQGGEAWNRQDDGCGPHPVASSDGLRRAVVLSRGQGPMAAFDGRLSTGRRATVSPPALPGAIPPHACSVP